MRIAISGVHGIGKTTLLEKLALVFQLDIVEEKARSLLNAKFSFRQVEENIETFKIFQREIIDLQSKDEMTLRDEFISDRPFIDSFVYVKERFTKERHTDVQYFRSYRERVYSIMKGRYDIIFFLRPSDDPITQDGIRNVNPFYISAIDELLEREYQLNDWGAEIVEIKSDIFNTRFFQASNKIKDYRALQRKKALEAKQPKRNGAKFLDWERVNE